jgi:restriction system protein
MRVAIDAWNTAYQRLSADAESRAAYAGTSDSISLRAIDGWRADVFEHGIAMLLERDGCTILRRHGGPNDQAADVIAVTPDGRRVVLQCKHSTKPGHRIEPRPLYELNGTAAPVHRADIVGIGTNRTLSDNARTFASGFGIHVIDRRTLELWATYGVSWLPAAGSVPAAT